MCLCMLIISVRVALDRLIDELGGTDEVAEMTGRKGRIVRNRRGVKCFQLRNLSNIEERKLFMNREQIRELGIKIEGCISH